jgi:hypothetical protein
MLDNLVFNLGSGQETIVHVPHVMCLDEYYLTNYATRKIHQICVEKSIDLCLQSLLGNITCFMDHMLCC